MATKRRAKARPITRKEAMSYSRTVPNGRGVTALAEVNGDGAYDRRYRATQRVLKKAEKENMSRYAANRAKPAKKKTKAQINAERLKNLEKARKASARKRAAKKRTEKSRRRKPRVYGKGKFRAIRAKIGNKSRDTYLYRTKAGNAAQIPDYALLGYASKKEMDDVRYARKGNKAQQQRRLRAYINRRDRLETRRGRAAAKTADRIKKGRGIFAPNSGKILTFEEWKAQKMRKNPPKKKRTKASYKAAAKKGQATRRRNAKKGTTGTKRKRTKASYKAAARKAAATRRRNAKKGTTSKRKRTKGKRTKASYKAAARKAAATRRRNAKKGTTSKRKRTTRGKSMTITMRANRRRGTRKGMRRRTARRAYMRNPIERTVTTFVEELKTALGLGVKVTIGYLGHRALTTVANEKLVPKINFLATAKYKDIITSTVVAALGVAGTVRFAPRKTVAAPIAAGIAASWLHKIILDLAARNLKEAVPYLSAYPNAEGLAYNPMGSYYGFQQHQIYPSSVGEFYEVTPQGSMNAGMGSHDLRLNQVTQAAAGMGGSPFVTQAAAGMGRSPLVTQAAAGMGQDLRLNQVTQAAAGTGEYVSYGVSGIGDYDEVGVSYRPTHTDEGISPNVHSAEQALSVAEAAAGVGSTDVPLQSTVNPVNMGDPIPDDPRGSRAGVFQGPDGIFG